jgi:hypothetical protein
VQTVEVEDDRVCAEKEAANGGKENPKFMAYDIFRSNEWQVFVSAQNEEERRGRWGERWHCQ